MEALCNAHHNNGHIPPQDVRMRAPESHQQQSVDSDEPISAAKPDHDNSTTSEEPKDFHIEHGKEDRGIRRIIRNFTPSYSLILFLLFRPKLPANVFLSRHQVVHYYYEHWRTVNHAPPAAIQRTLASSHLCHFLCHQSCTLPDLHDIVRPKVYPLSAALPCGPPPPPSKFVSGHVSCRPCDADQYDCLGVCAGMGAWFGDFGVGSLVDRHSVGLNYLLSSDVCHVSTPSDPSTEQA